MMTFLTFVAVAYLAWEASRYWHSEMLMTKMSNRFNIPVLTLRVSDSGRWELVDIDTTHVVSSGDTWEKAVRNLSITNAILFTSTKKFVAINNGKITGFL